MQYHFVGETQVSKMLTPWWLLFNTISIITANTLQSWTYNIIEIVSATSNPDIMDLSFEVERLGRSEFGVSGFIELKSDLYDNTTIEINSERSVEKSGAYRPFPMSIENQTLSRFMNTHYQRFIQQSAAKCGDNVPVVKEMFKAPLTKRYITLKGCQLDTGNLPSMAMSGYYKSYINISGPFEASVYILAFIENIYI